MWGLEVVPLHQREGDAEHMGGARTRGLRCQDCPSGLLLTDPLCRGRRAMQAPGRKGGKAQHASGLCSGLSWGVSHSPLDVVLSAHVAGSSPKGTLPSPLAALVLCLSVDLFPG